MTERSPSKWPVVALSTQYPYKREKIHEKRQLRDLASTPSGLRHPFVPFWENKGTGVRAVTSLNSIFAPQLSGTERLPS